MCTLHWPRARPCHPHTDTLALPPHTHLAPAPFRLGDKAPKSLLRAPVAARGSKTGPHDDCDSEDDDFYDRTASRAKAAARKAAPQTLKSLKEKMAELEAELAALKAEHAGVFCSG